MHVLHEGSVRYGPACGAVNSSLLKKDILLVVQNFSDSEPTNVEGYRQFTTPQDNVCARTERLSPQGHARRSRTSIQVSR